MESVILIENRYQWGWALTYHISLFAHVLSSERDEKVSLGLSQTRGWIHGWMSSTELKFPLMTEQRQNQLLSYCEGGCNYFILIINVIQWGLHSELSKRDRFQVLKGCSVWARGHSFKLCFGKRRSPNEAKHCETSISRQACGRDQQADLGGTLDSPPVPPSSAPTLSALLCTNNSQSELLETHRTTYPQLLFLDLVSFRRIELVLTWHLWILRFVWESVCLLGSSVLLVRL